MTKKKNRQNGSKVSGNRPSGPLALTNQVVVRRAPAAVSTVRLSRSFSFASAVLGTSAGCRVSGSVPWITLGAANTTGAGIYLLNATRVATTSLHPMNTGTLCPQLARLASCFSRYRWTSLRFDYCPMASTQSAVRLAFAVATDPSSPVGSVSNTTGFNTLLTTPVSQGFSPWVGWSLHMPCESGLKYTYLTGTDTASAARLSSSGVVACVADSNPGLDYTYGIVNLAFSIELYDPVPLAGPVALSAQVSDDDQKALASEVDSSYVRVASQATQPLTQSVIAANLLKAAKAAPGPPLGAPVQ